jgi:antitoxin (DNA-binding transcriptional repressor) of toxin-antitoxin stability system
VSLNFPQWTPAYTLLRYHHSVSVRMHDCDVVTSTNQIHNVTQEVVIKVRLITVRDLRTQTRRIGEWLADAEEVVVTSNGRPVAVLSPVTEDTVESEIMALRQARGIRAMNALQQTSHKLGLDRLSDDEIEQEVSNARQERSGGR